MIDVVKSGTAKALAAAAVLLCCSACAVTKPTVGGLTLVELPPLDKPAFQQVKVDWVRAEGRTDEALRDQFEKTLKTMPYFRGGDWPELRLTIDVPTIDSGVGACYLLVVASILTWPASWLLGVPNYCSWYEMEVVIKAQAGGFQREYEYSLVERNAGNILYYRPTPFDGSMAYLGHAVFAFSNQLAKDYAAFLAGKLKANPSRYSESLDPDLEEWYGSNKVSGGVVGDLNQSVAEFGTLLGRVAERTWSPAQRADAVKALAKWAATRALENPGDAFVVQTIASLEGFERDQNIPAEVQVECGKAAKQVRCAGRCTEKSTCLKQCGVE